MNTSRAYTLLLRDKLGNIEKGQSYSTGRVQTPVLALIVEREEEIENFVSTPFWEVYADFNFNGRTFRGKWFAGDQHRLTDVAKAEKLAAWCINKPAAIDDITIEDKEVMPPHFFSLSSLQILANKLYKMSPDQVLDACQSLYDKGHQSYPRTDSDRVTEEEAKEFPRILDRISRLVPYAQYFPTPIQTVLGNKRYVDPSRVSDHYAIIPTDQVPDLNSLSEHERLIYDLVVRSVIAAHYDAAIIRHTTILTYIADQFSFSTKGKQIVHEGWKAVMQTEDPDEKQENEQLLPEVHIGEEGIASSCEVKEGRTTPPKRLTQGDLIPLMKTAGNQLEDKELQSIMRKTHGLGTEATRAGIIKRLQDQNYIEIKNNLVYPTEKGRTLIKAVGLSALSSAETTAKWEQKLSEIGEGRYTHTSFIEQAKKLATKLVSDAIESVRTMDLSSKHDLKNRPASSPGQGGQAVASSEDNTAGPGEPVASRTPDTAQAPRSQQMIVREMRPANHPPSTSTGVGKRTVIPVRMDSSEQFSPVDDPDTDYMRPSIETEQPRIKQIPAELDLGPCRKCGRPVVDKGVLYGCSGWEDTGCDFKISKTIKGVVIEREVIKRLLATGSSGLIRGFIQKSKDPSKPDSKFDAILVFDKSGKLCWSYPSLNILKLPTYLLKPPTVSPPSEQEQKKEFADIEREAASLKLPCKVLKAYYGPRATRYELAPEPGLNVAHYKRYRANFQLALQAERITIDAPIPGKNVVGIEIPSKTPYTVNLRMLLENKEYLATKKALSFPIGMDMSGNPVYGDLADMPHLLVAGATGSGKSVFLNSLIISLLYGQTPDKLKFLFIDPKMVELSVYETIPHLFGPIVTDVRRASIALKKLVAEMEVRYEILRKFGVRNIQAYNEKVQSIPDAPQMPYIVLIIDELADLMMTTGPEVEECIQRLAQLARASGIHMVIATQRPSKQVLSPVIKANFPARIAFAVANQYDSQVILDSTGAEELLGKGDMYYQPRDSARRRLVSAFVSDEEIERVTDFLAKTYQPKKPAAAQNP
jgi:DNA topoisomerase III